jgi:hypothetical protein
MNVPGLYLRSAPGILAVMNDERAEDGRYVAPTGKDLGVRPAPDPGGAVPDPPYWYPRRRGAAATSQRRWWLGATAVLVVVLIVLPLVWSML